MKVSLELPFASENPALMELLIRAHQEAAESNSNASSQLCQIASAGSGDFSKGMIAAIASIGGMHAPLYQARMVYRHATKEWIANQKIVPGFGNSFYKGSIDPSFVNLDAVLRVTYPEVSARIDELHGWVKKVYPNAALYTAAVCELCKVPDGIESVLFVISRAPVWASRQV